MPAFTAAHLLVVDDEVPLMVALRNTLRDEGYRVTGVTSGAEALEALRQDTFDLVLTDLMMPAMNGIALLQDALIVDPQLVAIVMTGHGSIPTAVEAMRTGAIDYVLKPIKLSALIPALERALTLRRLRLKNAELEKRVRERTAELETANKDLEAFSSSVSHDLRTPLRTITGFADILLGHHAKNLPPEVRRHIELIHAGASEMSLLINGLLAFSRFGRQALHPEELDLERISREVWQELTAEQAGRDIELRLSPLPRTQGDPLLVRQVLVNLFSNALKYTRPRAPAVIELGWLKKKDGVAAVYFIRDNGVGFEMRHAENLFGMFQRLHHAREFEGTGVGLASVRRIIERHGGRIWAEAAPDLGATFFFTLPPFAELATVAKSG
ncbi:MAG: response regulator [Undibacterium sp.]|nr:response regulator [Opitutaceae bacterium]